VSGAALLDVNVLVALFDPGHVHHEAAHDWFADNAADGWATCPITESGFVRVLSAVGSPALRPATLVQHLRQFCASPAHEFWPDTISLADATVFDLSFTSHRNLTDIYLFGLARQKNGRLATFDRTIPLKAVAGARRGLLEDHRAGWVSAGGGFTCAGSARPPRRAATPPARPRTTRSARRPTGIPGASASVSDPSAES